ncbi:MAG: glycosyltransferase family 4 protein [Prevotellaceae bacterium]|jgi:glycosyltransferase involved in cell wall biosynthesis|nr:glycosyltransferase family 4 protein [Prevotellaceae bacterium]
MKIAYLLGSLNRGGTETLLLDVFKNADKAKFDFIGIHRKGGSLKEEFYDTQPKFFKLEPTFPYINYFFKLRQILKSEKIDIVHSQQFIDAFYAKIACLGTKIKVVQTYHGFENGNFLLKFIIKQTVENFFVSNYQREYYTKKYNLNLQKQTTVYNGISFEKFAKIYDKPNLPNNDKIGIKMAMVGNFVDVRDQFTVCNFLKLLKDSGIDFDFYFVGKKDEKTPHFYDECTKFCIKNQLDNVHFVGSRNDVPAILQNIDAFIYSTDHDTFGIAVIEAIAAEVPTFVNDWNVMKEITENGKFANLYKTKDENDLFDKFLLFLQNENFYKEQAKNNVTEIRKKFSIENHLNNLNKEYLKLS